MDQHVWNSFCVHLDKLASKNELFVSGAPRVPTIPVPKAKPPVSKPPTPPSHKTKTALLGAVGKAYSKAEKALRKKKALGLGVPLAGLVAGWHLAKKGKEPTKRQQPPLQYQEFQEF